MLEQVCKQREIPPDRHLYNVDVVGNQAGAGAPATISQSLDRLKQGDRIAVAVVGAGLSWGSCLLEMA